MFDVESVVLTDVVDELGTLRTVIDPQLKDLIKTEFNKDYTHFNGPQLREQLQALKDKQE